MTLQAVAPNDGIGDEGVRRHDTSQQERGGWGVREDGRCHRIGEDEGHKACQQSKHDKRACILLDALHVHLKTCEEHDVVEAYPSEQLKRVVTLQDVEAILSDHHACQHHPDDMRNTQFAHHDRCEEDDQQHHKEDQCGVCDG